MKNQLINHGKLIYQQVFFFTTKAVRRHCLQQQIAIYCLYLLISTIHGVVFTLLYSVFFFLINFFRFAFIVNCVENRVQLTPNLCAEQI